MLDSDFYSALAELRKLGRRDLDTEALSKKLSTERLDLLYDIVQGRLRVDTYTEIDVQLFALKALFDQRHVLAPLRGHPATDAPNTEYDPAKNGENVLKHGLSFSEITLSDTFGTMMIPAPNGDDGERWVMFSTLDAAHLSLPLPGVAGVISVLTIAKQVGFKFRLISSRRVQPESLRRDVKVATRNLELAEGERAVFLDHCTDRIKYWLAPQARQSSAS